MTYATTFSGIGGWELGLNACGWDLQWQCECDPFCRALLKERFGVPIYDDIRTLCEQHPKRVDILVGSPPCQPFSIAGTQGGTNDNRDLWPAMLKAVRYLRPAWFLCENVSNVANMVLSRWQDDLEAAGYQSIPFDIPACAAGLPTLERHVWLIAACDSIRLEGNSKAGIPGKSKLGQKKRQWWPSDYGPASSHGGWNLPKPYACRSRKGLPSFVDQIRAIGNAVPPQIAQIIGQALNQIESLNHDTTQANHD